MKDTVEYQIYIGCNDHNANDELVTIDELKHIITQYFVRREIGFSLVSVKGGFRHSNGDFVTENSICINVIGEPDFDIKKLARNVAMIMNQECSLVTRNKVQMNYR